VAEAVDRRVDKWRQPVLDDRSALKLAVFPFNQRGGITSADVDGKVLATWDESKRLALHADRVGLDAVVSAARWRGYGGAANLADRVFDPFTWATGLLAVTERIQVFATVHAPIYHPLIVAKAAATADHISGGRFGLNIVAGWFPDEFAMFGLKQREHDERYAYVTEWAELLKQLWTVDGDQNFHGRFFEAIAATSDPKPLQDPYPVLMNAGTSGAGQAFAARHSDVIFAGLQSMESAERQIREIKDFARGETGREVRVFGRGHVVCRPTEAEAREYWHWVHIENADVEAARRHVRLLRENSRSAEYSPEERKLLEGVVAGRWALPLCGTPDQIVGDMVQLHAAGLDGLVLSWVNYDEGLQQMEDELLPRLRVAGLRDAA
jgi:alkanesulfonate monooxygenase SsuD/methylene tetrahydromethanopterin reductase-like flavin-dependent oxidoreductase (luciferase family)